ncbi:RpiR family transcriptional regulator [Dolosicoccus paucivorans]|uniref:RpiR family transcriptional regulator n=2 Tax=Dolosicoccus paucivorans TaxID=84521 RepID=A0A2N6SPG0_9LACT|nr:RpiR family transcriptional regulator [Dolosicoccus paucivorans]
MMMAHRLTVIPRIEANYENLTPVERSIANYFLKKRKLAASDLKAKELAKKLHVSEPSLTRFAKKCGYKGYREFIFDYQQSSVRSALTDSPLIQRVMADYEELLNKSYHLIDESQLHRIVSLLKTKSRIYIYGKGSSGLVASELKLRFMRLGLICEAMSDEHLIKINNALLDESSLVIGISVSGKTSLIIDALQNAHQKKATTLLITANQDPLFEEFVSEIILVSLKSTLSRGQIISPQFPILIITDLIYAYYLEDERESKEKVFNQTLHALESLRKEPFKEQEE